jgi:hypothetical protein
MVRRGVFESQRFEGTHYLHLQGSTNPRSVLLERIHSCKWKQYVLPKRRDPTSMWRSTISQKTWIVSYITAKNLKLAGLQITWNRKRLLLPLPVYCTHCWNIRELCDGLLTTYWVIWSILTPFYLSVDVISLAFALLRPCRCSFITSFGLNYNDVSGEVNSVSRQI